MLEPFIGKLSRARPIERFLAQTEMVLWIFFIEDVAFAAPIHILSLIFYSCSYFCGAG